MSLKKTKKNKIIYFLVVCVLMLVTVCIQLFYEDTNFSEDFIAKESNIENVVESNNLSDTLDNSELLTVHYIDVGQADAILIMYGNSSMLIDAGTNSAKDIVTNYLKNKGITKLDYVIGTHAHEDHIGGMAQIVNSFDIGTLLFPKQTSTTKTYQNFVTAVKNKNLKLTAPSVGNEYFLGEAKFTVLAPNNISYDDANNYSICIRLEYGNNSFLFVGDAEDVSETEMLKANVNLKSDVLKIGHHGSSSSSTQEFLNAISPKYAVICVGKNNDYHHPTKKVMNRLKNMNILVYRTDECGTIVATSDGSNISFNVAPGSYKYATN